MKMKTMAVITIKKTVLIKSIYFIYMQKLEIAFKSQELGLQNKMNTNKNGVSAVTLISFENLNRLKL